MSAPGLFDCEPAVESDAKISDCGNYRYWLTRIWDRSKPLLIWVMLNPSIADADADDPTVRRCIAFAKAWGYGGIIIVNLYALRSTDPKALWKHPDPIGPDNDLELDTAAYRGAMVMLAWGANAPKERATEVARILWNACLAAEIRIAVLGWTKAGAPRHPLYVRADTLPEFCDEAELVGAA